LSFYTHGPLAEIYSTSLCICVMLVSCLHCTYMHNCHVPYIVCVVCHVFAVCVPGCVLREMFVTSLSSAHAVCALCDWYVLHVLSTYVVCIWYALFVFAVCVVYCMQFCVCCGVLHVPCIVCILGQ
jgi:hypothetical protein